MKKFLSRFKFNAPVTLGFVAVCAFTLFLNHLTGGRSNRLLFSTYRSSLLDPLTYARAFGYTVGHADIAHFAGNMTYILLLGPLVEEKYGSRSLLEMMGVTAVITAIAIAIFVPQGALGASGIVFMLIILSSISNIKNGEIPITFVIVCIIYIGGEIANSFKENNISELGHILGGICGGVFGLVLAGSEKK